MTDEEEQKLNELMQMAQMGSTVEGVTAGYGTYPVGDQAQALTTTTPEIPIPTVTP